MNVLADKAKMVDSLLGKIQIKYGDWNLNFVDVYRIPLTQEEIETALALDTRSMISYVYEKDPNHKAEILFMRVVPEENAGRNYAFRVLEGGRFVGESCESFMEALNALYGYLGSFCFVHR